MKENSHLRLAESASVRLCELPDNEFAMGGEIDRMAREAGYSSGRAFANEQNLWSATVGQVVAILKTGGASISRERD